MASVDCIRFRPHTLQNHTPLMPSKVGYRTWINDLLSSHTMLLHRPCTLPSSPGNPSSLLTVSCRPRTSKGKCESWTSMTVRVNDLAHNPAILLHLWLLSEQWAQGCLPQWNGSFWQCWNDVQIEFLCFPLPRFRVILNNTSSMRITQLPSEK